MNIKLGAFIIIGIICGILSVYVTPKDQKRYIDKNTGEKIITPEEKVRYGYAATLECVFWATISLSSILLFV